MPIETMEQRSAPTALTAPAAPSLDELALELDRQLDTLVARGAPWAAAMTDGQFRAHLAPLADRLPEVAATIARTRRERDPLAADDGPPRLPFVLVVGGELLSPQRAAGLVRRDERRLIVSMLDDEAFAAFRPIETVRLPPGGAYLLVDVDAGWATRNDPPDTALPRLQEAGRSPLTVEEGIAVATHRPEVVATNAGFSLLGSRRGDRRVTALWISRGAPKLGWCFAGVPHTWLGSASCAGRLGM
ncbi:DUF5701 family protein [Conexibacter arvalis]|uniref:Uncharacterized protein n=1 Tax=Conexibacter arvalis TaxID=912552 RepID=A0A840IIZ5_9ACTN|nr:DUF5701 family protein [Conexibacter arvalis]MBB4664153.1 hypothetical protein [Conexibacter arvalis]